MAMLKTLIGLAFSALLIEIAMATNYTVGSPSGSWDQTTNLATWASSKNFTVGDNLLFQYGGMHSVLEVSKTDYDSCSTSNPIQSDSSGSTLVPLSSTGKRYFICGTAGHCGMGMKVEIDTLAASTSPPPSPATPATSPAPSVTTPATPPAPSVATPATPPASGPATPATSPAPGAAIPATSPIPQASTPGSAPGMAPSSPSDSSPGTSPGVEGPTTSPSPDSLTPSPPPPSSANKISLAIGSSLVIMLLAF
ncbi:hypothetical protein ACFE04_030735 [Oxalis oulophora]